VNYSTVLKPIDGSSKRCGMGTRDLWHWGFVYLLKQRGPPNFEVRAEVPLSSHPQRADALLLRRQGAPNLDGEAQVLRNLWPRLATWTVLEFKSPSRGFRRGDLMRLASYGAQYHALENEQILDPRDLTLVLVVPSRTAVLDDEIRRMRWTLTPLGDGYGQIDGGVYTIFLVVTDEVAVGEADDFLRVFSHYKVQTQEAFWWWQQWRAEDGTMPDIKDMEGYDEMLLKFIGTLSPDKRLLGLTPEERVQGLAPEQRLADLAPEQQLLALSDEVLQSFPEDYLRSLSPEVQTAIRNRIRRSRGQ
jgi:hypothetical protein